MVGIVGGGEAPRQHSRPREAARKEEAVSPALVWAAGARRAAIQEAAGLFDSNPTVTAARIVCALS